MYNEEVRYLIEYISRYYSYIGMQYEYGKICGNESMNGIVCHLPHSKIKYPEKPEFLFLILSCSFNYLKGLLRKIKGG